MSGDRVIAPRTGDPDNESYAFMCPGCNKLHVFNAAGKPPVWEFNRDLVKPTIAPSIGTTLYDGKYCHCYVTDGMIRFLTDSWHHLKGQTVPLKPVFKETTNVDDEIRNGERRDLEDSERIARDLQR